MTESDNRSERAFEITKNVKMSTAQTLREVRSGCCGNCEVTDQLQAENVRLHALLRDIVQYTNRVAEQAPGRILFKENTE